MSQFEEAAEFATPTWCDVIKPANVMDIGIRPLWPSPRIVGPAYTVRCAPGDNLMLHAAIHRAGRGSVLVVQAGDLDHAVAGGKVCAVAQRNGITGFIVDGAVRDLVEIREMGFPVFARGVIPIPGVRETLGAIAEPVVVGGANVAHGDTVVADEEGVVVVPAEIFEDRLVAAAKRSAEEKTEDLNDWDAGHQAAVFATLKALGYSMPT